VQVAKKLCALVCVSLCFSLSLAACGAAGGESIATVGGVGISKAELNHWTAVEFVTDYDQTGQRSVPRGLVPVPPTFTACIARRRAATASKAKGHVAIDPKQLKRECALDYKRVQEHVLDVLIVFQWRMKEAARYGVKVSRAEVRHEYARFSGERFPHAGELQRFLAHTGESMADEWLRMRIDLLGTKVTAKERVKYGGFVTPAQQQAYLAASEAATKKWLSETSCKTGFVVPNCKQYKGALRPDTRI
jgi:hypothetical protein